MVAVTMAILKKTLSEVKTSSEKLFQGEITIGKKECWLIGLVLVLSGITIGLLKAPLTHGVSISIGSNNGNHNGNNSANGNDGCGTSDMAENAVKELCKPIAAKKEEKKKCGKRHGSRKGHDKR